MRLTVMRKQTLGLKALEGKQRQDLLEQIERIKHYLWHGNVFQALKHIEFLQLVLARVYGPFRKKFGPPHSLLPPLAEAPALRAGSSGSFPPPFYRAAETVTVGSGLNNMSAISDPIQ